MVTSLRLALALVGCLSLVGCAAEPVSRNETPVEDPGTLPPSRSTTTDDGDSDDSTLPVTPVDDDTTTADRAPPSQGGDAVVTPPKAPKPAEAPAAIEKTQSCPAVSGEHKSVTTVVYTLTDGVVKIIKMTVLVTNKDERNENDADIFLTQSGGSETKMFWTGDVLANGKTIELPNAKTLAPKTGAKMRIETNFDRALTDPHADCTINF